MPEMVSKFIELVENYNIIPCLFQFPAFIKNLFHIALATGRGNDFAGNI